MPVVSRDEGFERLTRRHAIKVVTNDRVSAEDVSYAVGEVVGFQSVKSASRMNGGIVIFLDDVDKVDSVVEKGIVVRDTFTPVLPLVSPAKKIIISNAPPFLKNEDLAKELSRFGKVVSQVKMVLLGCKSPQLKHVVCHRRQVYMVLKENELNLTLNFKVDGFNYTVFASSDNMKCFGCGVEGHLIRSCPQRPPPAAPPAPVVAAESSGEGSAGPSGTKDAQSAQQPVSNSLDAQQLNEAEIEIDAAVIQEQVPIQVHVVQNDQNLIGNNVVEGAEAQTSVKSKLKKKNGNKENSKPCQAGNAVKEVLTSESVSVEKSSASSSSTSVVRDTQGEKTKAPAIAQNMVFGPIPVSAGKKDVFEDLCLSSKPTKRKSTEKEQAGAKGKNLKAMEHVSTSDDDECDWSPSQEEGLSPSQEAEIEFYPIDKISKFLSDTKGLRGLKIEDFFPDLRGFVKSVTLLIKQDGAFSDQEIWRLKKMVTKVKKATPIEDDDV